MFPFLLTNTIILLINYFVNFYAYCRLKEHLIVASFDLKLSIIVLLVIIEALLLAFLKLYNVLIKNNIRLTIVKGIADNDALTGVLSREKGLSILKSKILTSKKDNNPLTICFIDINNLKKVNDRFGHEEGDRLIEVVSSTIKYKLRRFDVMCRLGGDEFLIVFDSCSLDDAKASWIRIEKEINKLNDSDKFKFCISVSIGFAEYNKEIHTTIKSFIKEADDEMYRQKKINKFYEKVNKTNN
ncbi:MAG: GGDEF domain-containing protein [Acidaminobacteraceae bacterium]